MTARAGRIGVIGGGLGGLAAACVLAARGYAVTLFEKSPWLGGKAAVLRAQGYRFDMGPTILTLPSVLRCIFAEAERKLEDYLELIRLDPQWRCFFSDGATLDLLADVEPMCQALERFAPGGQVSQGYRRFLDFSARLHSISQRFFFWRSIGSIWDMLDLKDLCKPRMLADVLAMRLGQSVAQAVRSHVPEPRVAQMLDHFTQYVGSAPDASPAVLCGIAHMQTREGVWYPRGGTAAVPQALTRLAEELGVQLRTGVGVRRILLDGNTVAGLETDSGEQVPLAAVVSNADSVRTHRELLAGTRAAKRFEQPLRPGTGLLRSGPLPWAGSDLRAVVAPQLCLFPRSRRGVRGRLSPGPTRARPDLLRLRPCPDRSGSRSTGWGGPLRFGPYALPPTRAGLAADVSGLPADHSPQVGRHGGTDRPGAANLLRGPADAARHPRALPGAEWGHLRAGQSWTLFRGVQAGQSQQGRQGTVPGRRRGASGTGNAAGAHVRVDRGRYTRPGWGGAAQCNPFATFTV